MTYFESDTRVTVFTVALGLQLVLLVTAALIGSDIHINPIFLIR